MEEITVHRYCFVLSESDVGKTFVNMENKAPTREVILTMEIYSHHDDCFVILDIAQTPDERMADDVSELLERLGFIDDIKEERLNEVKWIFKKPVYRGQGSTTKRKFKRTVMTLQLEPDKELVREYKRLHRPEHIWPEVLINMDNIGVFDMKIYLKGYRAFLIMDTRPDFNMVDDGRRWAAMPREKEWQAHVAQFQKTDATSKAVEKWTIIPRFFAI